MIENKKRKPKTAKQLLKKAYEKRALRKIRLGQLDSAHKDLKIKVKL